MVAAVMDDVAVSEWPCLAVPYSHRILPLLGACAPAGPSDRRRSDPSEGGPSRRSRNQQPASRDMLTIGTPSQALECV